MFQEPRNRFQSIPGGLVRQIGLSYRPAKLQAGGSDSLESIPVLLKRLQIWAQGIQKPAQ